jgi:hypothetical protein
MKLSLRLRFYLECSLGIYTMGTTMGFPVEIINFHKERTTFSQHNMNYTSLDFHMEPTTFSH